MLILSSSPALWLLASFLADTVQQSSLMAAGQLPCRTLLGCGHWPASSLPVLLWPLTSFIIVTVPFAAAGQLPHCQCSLCGRWPASSVPVFPLRPLASLLALSLTFFLSLLFFFFESLGLLVGLTAKLCICPPACLSRGAWSQLGLSEWGGVGRAHFPASCRQLVLWPRCGGPSYQLYFVV